MNANANANLNLNVETNESNRISSNLVVKYATEDSMGQGGDESCNQLYRESAVYYDYYLNLFWLIFKFSFWNEYDFFKGLFVENRALSWNG